LPELRDSLARRGYAAWAMRLTVLVAERAASVTSASPRETP
jgi:Fe-S cluster biosynthesis and repair protein YggX